MHHWNLFTNLCAWGAGLSACVLTIGFSVIFVLATFLFLIRPRDGR